jgi:hypothetical protein
MKVGGVVSGEGTVVDAVADNAQLAFSSHLDDRRGPVWHARTSERTAVEHEARAVEDG